MANATYDQPLRIMGTAYTEKFHVDSAAARTIWKGEPLIINASCDAENVVSQSVEALVDGDIFVGIATEAFKNALGDSEAGPASVVEAYVGPTIVGFKSAVFATADLGDDVYMADTTTLGKANGAFAKIGTLHRVMDGYAFVRLVTPVTLDVP